MKGSSTSTAIIIVLTIIIGALLYLQTSDGGKYYCEDYSLENYSTLEKGLIGDMVSIYRINQLDAVNTMMRTRVTNPDLGFNGTESILFDMDTISKFLYHIKRGLLLNSNDPTNEKIGLRFYYAAYPKKSTWGSSGYKDLANFLGNNVTEQYQERHTLVIIPTRVNSNNVVVDFDPFDKKTYETGLTKYERSQELLGTTLVDNSPESKTTVMGLTGQTDNANTAARNHGSLYPPYPTTGLGF